MPPPSSARPAVRERDELLRDVMGRIGDKWSVTVICRLDDGPLRFNALRRAADGITQRMLSATVRRLERDGLISRTVAATVPPSVEYALTDRGRSLHGVLASLVAWTEANFDEIRRGREEYDAAAESRVQMTADPSRRTSAAAERGQASPAGKAAAAELAPGSQAHAD